MPLARYVNRTMPYSISIPRLAAPILNGSMRLVDDNTHHDLPAIERKEMLLRHPKTLLPIVAMTPMKSMFATLEMMEYLHTFLLRVVAP